MARILALLLLAARLASPCGATQAVPGRFSPASPVPARLAFAWQGAFGSSPGVAFPGLLGLGLDLRSPLITETLARSLARAGLDPRGLAGAPAPLQEAAVRVALRTRAEALLAWASSAEEAPDLLSSDALIELDAAREQLGDLSLLSPALGEDFQVRELVVVRASVSKRREQRSSAWVSEALQRLGVKEDAVWLGRTALVHLPEGGVLALKRQKPEASAGVEARRMQQARRVGLDAPIPLPRGDGSFSHSGQDGSYLAYLLPGKLAPGFLTYPNQPLPRDWTAGRKEAAVRLTASRSIREMVQLAKSGRFHSSLAPLSHSEVHWEWDYWRWSAWVPGALRYGPSSIHDWRSALSYPNIRLSGLADYEHVERLPAGAVPHVHEWVKTAHDAYSAVGQNLTEWALVVLHASAVNGVPPERAARILLKGLERHSSGLLGGPAASLEAPRTLAALEETARAFRRFHDRSSALPAWAAAAVNRVVGLFSVRRVPAGEAPVLPGGVIHPLVMDALHPYVEELRGRGALGARETASPHQPFAPAAATLLAFCSLLGYTALVSWVLAGLRLVHIMAPDLWLPSAAAGALLVLALALRDLRSILLTRRS